MPRVILVGGGSSSGKTYIDSSVIRNLGEENVVMLTLDDYYRDQTSLSREERLKVNYDHPKAFDWPLMRQQIQDLKDGKTINKPIYDFTLRNRSAKTEQIVPKKLIVVEGIMALVDKKLRDSCDLRVFISASPERRFLRRIIRDRKERGREFHNIVNQYFTTVQPMYEEIIGPSANYADIIVNNDGVANLAIDVLTRVFREELDKADKGDFAPRKMNDEFCDKTLAEAFQESSKV
jgi:uridine kinase